MVLRKGHPQLPPDFIQDGVNKLAVRVRHDGALLQAWEKQRIGRDRMKACLWATSFVPTGQTSHPSSVQSSHLGVNTAWHVLPHSGVRRFWQSSIFGMLRGEETPLSAHWQPTLWGSRKSPGSAGIKLSLGAGQRIGNTFPFHVLLVGNLPRLTLQY